MHRRSYSQWPTSFFHPLIVPSNRFLIARQNPTFGNGKLIDSMQHDGLWEVYNQFPMGNCGEHTASKYGITRQDVDAHAIESYTRAANAWKSGAFDKEIAPVVIKDRRVCKHHESPP
jgi:acetyl-CoA C-acetyltransferase